MRNGDFRVGAVVKDAKEQLRALPDPATYGLLRHLNPGCGFGRRADRLQPLSGVRGEPPEELWRSADLEMLRPRRRRSTCR